MNVKSYVSLVKSKSIWTNMPHDGNWTKVKARWAWIWLYLQFTASLKIFQFRGDWQLVSIVPCNWTIHLLFRHMGRCLGSHLRLDSPIPWTMCEMMNHGRCMHGPTFPPNLLPFIWSCILWKSLILSLFHNGVL